MANAYIALVFILTAGAMFWRPMKHELTEEAYHDNKLLYHKASDRQDLCDRAFSVACVLAFLPIIGAGLDVWQDSAFAETQLAEKLLVMPFWTLSAVIIPMALVGGGRTIYHRMWRTAKQD